MKKTANRRYFLVASAAIATSVAAGLPRLARARELAPTPALTAGPFYPRVFPKDVDNDLTRVAGRTAIANGTPLELGGRILDTRGAPVANAKIEIWHCDSRGVYHHVGEDVADMDKEFQGYGVAITDAEGSYRFRTIKPVAYSGRTPHIHYIVTPNKGRGVTSQMFLEGEAQNERDFLYRAVKGTDPRERLLMKLSGSETLRGAMDIVVQG